jgi:hypothetical protein
VEDEDRPASLWERQQSRRRSAERFAAREDPNGVEIGPAMLIRVKRDMGVSAPGEAATVSVGKNACGSLEDVASKMRDGLGAVARHNAREHLLDKILDFIRIIHPAAKKTGQ